MPSCQLSLCYHEVVLCRLVLSSFISVWQCGWTQAPSGTLLVGGTTQAHRVQHSTSELSCLSWSHCLTASLPVLDLVGLCLSCRVCLTRVLSSVISEVFSLGYRDRQASNIVLSIIVPTCLQRIIPYFEEAKKRREDRRGEVMKEEYRSDTAAGVYHVVDGSKRIWPS